MTDVHKDGRHLTTTDELVAYYDGATSIPKPVLDVAIPAAIDELYTGRDDYGNMHSSGAAAAVAALMASRTWDT